MKKHLLTICSFLLLLFSCKKDDDNKSDPSAVTVENLSASYVLTAATARYLGQDIDLMSNDALLPACRKDDVMTLKKDNTYVTTDAGTTCTPNGTQTGTWSLPNTSTIILDNETLTILSFDGTNLKVTYKEDTNVGKVDVTATFKKQ